MHDNLTKAVSLLGVGEVYIQNKQGEATGLISSSEHAKALFAYLNMADYLSESLIKKAVEYLAAAKVFARDKAIVLADLITACKLSNQNGQFDGECFIENFAKQTYFTVSDIIDLIVFLQQTAFDRQCGVERDRLQVKPWMKKHNLAFKEYATKLSVVSPLVPQKNHYAAVGIMCASSGRVKTRLAYFLNLTINFDFVWVLSGDRELLEGLDEGEIMEQTARYFEKPIKYVKKQVGVDTREFLEGVTETMMVNYLIQQTCPHKKIEIIDSAIELGHWRTTAAKSATDIADIMIDKIQLREIKPAQDGRYY